MSDTASQTVTPLYDNDITMLINTQIDNGDSDSIEGWIDVDARLQIVASDHAVALNFSYYGDSTKDSSRERTVKDIQREMTAVDRLLSEVQAFRNRFAEQVKADLDRLNKQ